MRLLVFDSLATQAFHLKVSTIPVLERKKEKKKRLIGQVKIISQDKYLERYRGIEIHHTFYNLALDIGMKQS